MFQFFLITLLQTNSTTFCNTSNERVFHTGLFFTAPRPKEEFYCFASYFLIRKHFAKLRGGVLVLIDYHKTFRGTSLNRIIFPLLQLDPVWAVSVSHDLSACSLSLVVSEHLQVLH